MLCYVMCEKKKMLITKKKNCNVVEELGKTGSGKDLCAFHGNTRRTNNKPKPKGTKNRMTANRQPLHSTTHKELKKH